MNRTAMFLMAGVLGWAVVPASAHTVNADVLNVRSGPGTSYSIVGTLSKGTVVNVVSTSGSWSKIDSPKAGWVSSEFLTNTPHTTTTTKYVNTDNLNVRSGPGTGYSIVGTLSRGTAVTVTGTSGDWSKISAPKAGWVSSAYLSSTPPSTSTGADFLWPANGQIWGGYYDMRSSGLHRAIDVCNPVGTPIYASRGGYLGTQAYNSGYGNWVQVTHTAGYFTRYAHLNGFYGSRRTVAAGTQVGTMGKTGAANGVSHVHFEIWRYDTRLFAPSYNGQNVRAKAAINYNYAGL